MLQRLFIRKPPIMKWSTDVRHQQLMTNHIHDEYSYKLTLWYLSIRVVYKTPLNITTQLNT